MTSTSTRTVSARIPVGLYQKLLKLSNKRNENVNDYILRTLRTITQYKE
jgi:hypothetical protein